MAKIILWGDTAVECYQRVQMLPVKKTSLASLAEEDVLPRAGAASYLTDCMPGLSQPYHVAVFRQEDRRNLVGLRCHVMADSLCDSTGYYVASGVLTLSPDLALLQCCRSRSLVEVIALATTLCSAYGISPSGSLFERPPLTQPESIASTCHRHSGAFGAETLLKGNKWVVPNAASPREVALALVLSLPCRLGGYGLPRPTLNNPVRLFERMRGIAASSYYVADLCWPKEHLILEYDSDEFHLTSDQQYRDAVKRMVLEKMGYRVLTVTRRQLNTPNEMDKVAKVVASALNQQLRIRCNDFHSKQMKLWQAAGLSAPGFGDLCSPTTLQIP